MRTKQLRFAFSVPFLIALIFMVSHARAGQGQLAWNAPTTNTDGTSLTDLSSYTLYYWQANWEFPASINVGNQTT